MPFMMEGSGQNHSWDVLLKWGRMPKGSGNQRESTKLKEKHLLQVRRQRAEGARGLQPHLTVGRLVSRGLRSVTSPPWGDSVSSTFSGGDNQLILWLSATVAATTPHHHHLLKFSFSHKFSDSASPPPSHLYLQDQKLASHTLHVLLPWGGWYGRLIKIQLIKRVGR